MECTWESPRCDSRLAANSAGLWASESVCSLFRTMGFLSPVFSVSLRIQVSGWGGSLGVKGRGECSSCSCIFWLSAGSACRLRAQHWNNSGPPPEATQSAPNKYLASFEMLPLCKVSWRESVCEPFKGFPIAPDGIPLSWVGQGLWESPGWSKQHRFRFGAHLQDVC